MDGGAGEEGSDLRDAEDVVVVVVREEDLGDFDGGLGGGGGEREGGAEVGGVDWKTLGGVEEDAVGAGTDEVGVCALEGELGELDGDEEMGVGEGETEGRGEGVLFRDCPQECESHGARAVRRLEAGEEQRTALLGILYVLLRPCRLFGRGRCWRTFFL